jgi:hypothetical protein
MKRWTLALLLFFPFALAQNQTANPPGNSSSVQAGQPDQITLPQGTQISIRVTDEVNRSIPPF